MEEAPIAVDVANLTKFYPGQTPDNYALNDVSFQVPMGKILCILGPNGSGKTTLLKILAGLVHPDSGSIQLMGRNFNDNPMEIRAQLGWMPSEERSGFYGRLKGHDNLEFFSTLYNLPPGEFERVLGNIALQLGLKDEVNVMLLKASSGARQKLAFARALMHNPAVLLLDEPLRNLDPHTVRRFRRLIKDHLTRIQKKTIILSTHQLEEARRVGDFILFMRDGRVVQFLSALELEKVLKQSTIEEYYMKTIGSDEPS